MTPDRAIVHVVVRGRVQGVGYRAWTAREATVRGLVGWVRNRRDGGVEATFGGRPEDVAAMVEACRSGPWSARVDALDQDAGTESALAEGTDAAGFAILPTLEP